MSGDGVGQPGGTEGRRRREGGREGEKSKRACVPSPEADAL